MLVSFYRGLDERVGGLEEHAERIEAQLNNHTIALDAIVKMITTMQSDINEIKRELS